MTWFKVDDQLHDHLKFRTLGRDRMAATGLWTTCGSWAGANDTDGFVPAEIVKRFDPKLRLAGVLVAANLWYVAENGPEPGYRFHEWDDWQPTKASREATRQRVAKHRAGKNGNASSNDRSAVTADVRNADGNALRTDPRALPGPASSSYGTTTRPDPARPQGDASPTAERAVATFMPRGISRLDRRSLARLCDVAADDGASWSAIEHALIEWRGRSDVSPGFLPSLITNAVKAEHGAQAGRPAAPRPSTTDQRVEAVEALRHTGTDTPSHGLQIISGGQP